VTTFFNYAIEDGITELLKRTGELEVLFIKNRFDFQLSFPFG